MVDVVYEIPSSEIRIREERGEEAIRVNRVLQCCADDVNDVLESYKDYPDCVYTVLLVNLIKKAKERHGKEDFLTLCDAFWNSIEHKK